MITIIIIFFVATFVWAFYMDKKYGKPCEHTYNNGRVECGFRICDKCYQANDDDVQADIDKL